MLSDPSERERELLGAIPYQRNEAVLHTDRSAAAAPALGALGVELPPARRAEAALDRDLLDEPPAAAARGPRLLRDAEPQRGDRPAARDPHDLLLPPRLHAGAASRRRPAMREISGSSAARTTAAPTGAGAFTRTACAARSRACEPFGVDAVRSALYEGAVRHRRLGGAASRAGAPQYEFRHRLFMAYLDLDELPARSRRACSAPRAARRSPGFAARDHLGDPDATARRLGSRAGRRAHRPAPGRADRPAHAPALLRAQLQPGELLLVLRGRDGERVAGRGRARHEHAVGREPLLRARRGDARRPRQRAARARRLREAAARLAADGHGPRLRAAHRPSPASGSRCTSSPRRADGGGARRSSTRRCRWRAASSSARDAGAAARALPAADGRDPCAHLLARRCACGCAARAYHPHPRERRRPSDRAGAGVTGTGSSPAPRPRRPARAAAAGLRSRGASSCARCGASRRPARAARGPAADRARAPGRGEPAARGDRGPLPPLLPPAAARQRRPVRVLPRRALGVQRPRRDDADRGAQRRRARPRAAHRRAAPASRRSAARAGCTRNTPRRSRRQIEAHYDLGNELFEQFLDETMMYSCAFFETPQTTPARGLDREARADLRPPAARPGDHVLEIGTGWGGFASTPPAATAAASPRRRSRASSTPTRAPASPRRG